MKFWSPRSGINVLIQLNTQITNLARSQSTSLVNQWQTITLDFNGINVNNLFVLILVGFNYNVGQNEVFYFDDIKTNSLGDLHKYISLDVFKKMYF